MRKILPFLLLSIVLLLAISAGILYFGHLRNAKVEENLIMEVAERPPEKTLKPGELIITYSKPNPNQREILRTVILNGVTIENLSFSEIEVKGEKKPLLSLTTSFNYEGKDRRLTIPIIDSIYFRLPGKEGFQDPELVSVENFSLSGGAMINFGLAYLPKGSVIARDELIGFCESRSHEGCLLYVELGFGENTINFEEYFRDLLANQENPQLDYVIAFPSIISILPK